MAEQMRDREEVFDTFSRLGEDREQEAQAPLSLVLQDTFRDGYLAGKIAALGWVLGDPGYLVGMDLDYEGWRAEMSEGKDRM
jgi:hypothetical protein